MHHKQYSTIAIGVLFSFLFNFLIVQVLIVQVLIVVKHSLLCIFRSWQFIHTMHKSKMAFSFNWS